MFPARSAYLLLSTLALACLSCFCLITKLCSSLDSLSRVDFAFRLMEVLQKPVVFALSPCLVASMNCLSSCLFMLLNKYIFYLSEGQTFHFLISEKCWLLHLVFNHHMWYVIVFIFQVIACSYIIYICQMLLGRQQAETLMHWLQLSSDDFIK